MNDDNLSDTTTRVIPFKPKLVPVEVDPKAPDESVVSLLEFWLKKAQAGEIAFVAIAIVDAEGIAASAWCPMDMDSVEITKSLGSVSYLNHRFNASAYEGDVYSDEQPEGPKA